jgi:hypothetical protein
MWLQEHSTRRKQRPMEARERFAFLWTAAQPVVSSYIAPARA